MIREIEDLVNLVELRDVVTYEVRARRLDGGFEVEGAEELGAFESGDDLDDEDRPILRGVQVMTRSDDDSLDVRAVARVDNSTAVVNVDVAALYGKTFAFDIEADVLQDFVARVSMMTLFPFIREAVHAESARIGIPMKLGLLRASTLRPTPEGD